ACVVGRPTLVGACHQAVDGATTQAKWLLRQPQCVISVGVSDHGVGHRVINFGCDVPERQLDGRAAVDS
ncbi:MAG: hypothetical protein LC749_06480, partial [Actinobacteria bacterium]|nr:hypothetical protein [Actinomycetota bacterium]